MDDMIVKVIITHELISVVLSLTSDVVHVEFFVDLGHHESENGDDVRWVVLNLDV